MPHVYDSTSGDANSTSVVLNAPVGLKLTRTFQPYASIERFLRDDKLMGFVINPGLVPLVKAISLAVRGRQLLVTRMVAARDGDQGVVAHVDGFGVRLLMYRDEDSKDTHIVWEGLYGVA